ncbi:hypothetical protein SCE1572_06040 [Sorangium cellulosum So0157-2]|uniref:Uncharacterized protein n=1 Tax=Sorangium cellulosum So0157-2 TaxID=1254432 RepID=S4XLN2_SORCE|nr:hypothetical protein SCE1572_06040 [Sorangium cellulosum So0157-2]
MAEPEEKLTPAQQALAASALHEVSGAARRLAPKLRKHLSFDELMSLGRGGSSRRRSPTIRRRTTASRGSRGTASGARCSTAISGRRGSRTG